MKASAFKCPKFFKKKIKKKCKNKNKFGREKKNILSPILIWLTFIEKTIPYPLYTKVYVNVQNHPTMHNTQIFLREGLFLSSRK